MASSAEGSVGSVVCNFLVFEAVNQNSVSKLKLAKNTYSEIELVNSLAQCNEKNQTPLVVAMKRRNYSVIEELVNWISKNEVFKNKECEPMVLIIIDQLAPHIPIVELMDYLITDLYDTLQNTNNSNWLEFIAQVFIKSTSFARQDRIIALELIGASLMIFSGCMYTHERVVGLQCWKESMTLRYFPADGEPLLPKIPDVCVPSATSSAVFGSAVEVMTIEELKLLQEDFERYCLTLNHIMRLPCFQRIQTQALLVIRRISTQADLRHPHWLYLENMRVFGGYLMRTQLRNDQDYSVDSKIVINIFLLVLEQATGFDPKIHPRKLFQSSVLTLWHLQFFFFRIFKNQEPPGSPESEELSYANLLTPTKFITTIQWDHFDSIEDIVSFTNLVCGYLIFLDTISPRMANEEKHKLEEYYSTFIRHFFPSRTTTFLHVAVRRNIWNAENFAVMLQIIKLILKLGADPNAIDGLGQTPLLILAGMKSINLGEYLLVFQALVNAGTHLDTAKDDGDTVLSVLKRNVMECKQEGSIVDPYFESLLNTVFPLSCYAARVIRRHGIRFDEDRLPFHLQEFVARHSGKDFTD